MNSNGFVTLSGFRSTITMDAMISNFQNLLMGDDLGDLMNYIIGDIFPFMVRTQQAQVSASLETIVLERVNEEWAGLTLEQLIQQIMEYK